MVNKFKVGDVVKVAESGSGCAGEEIGEIVRITQIGIYNNDTGYKVSPAVGNTKTSSYDGFIGEISFKLASWKERFKWNLKKATELYV